MTIEAAARRSELFLRTVERDPEVGLRLAGGHKPRLRSSPDTPRLILLRRIQARLLCNLHTKCNLTTVPDFNAVATIILEGRSFAEQVAADHFDAFASYPTSMAMAHNMRSAVIGRLLSEETPFSVEDRYLDFGRVGIVAPDSDATFLLKSRATIPLDCPLPVVDRYLDVSEDVIFLLAFEFVDSNLDLAIAPAREIRVEGRKRYRLLDNLQDLGQWDGAGGTGGKPQTFDQDEDENWVDLWSEIDDDTGTGM